MRIRLPRGIPLPLLLSGLGIAFTVVLAGVALNETFENEDDLFQADAAAIYDSLSERINALGEIATSLSTLVNSATRVDADQFRIFAEAIQARHPYVVSTAFLPLITGPERTAFERERRERGFITFEIKNRDGAAGFQRAPERRFYFPIFYLEPFEPATAPLIGLDVLGERKYGQIARQAISTGNIAPVPNGGPEAGLPGQLLLAPVYGGKTLPATPEAREAMINGLVGIGFLPGPMLEDAIKITATAAQWRILDQQGGEICAASYPGTRPEPGGGLVPLTLTRTYTKDFYGNEYELVISRPLHWHDLDYTSVLLVALAGMVITLLLAVAGRQVSCRALELETRNREVEKQVAEKTAALSESNRLLRLEMEERRRVEDELRHTQKMEAIGRLAGGIAHDFNNLLAAIIGYTELAVMEVPEESSVQDDLAEILKASHRAKKIVQQILQFSRRARDERSPMLLGPVIEEALSLLRASLPAGVEIEKDIRAEGGPVLADSTQIHQVMINLGTNAGYAMQEKGGILRVELGMVEKGRSAAGKHLPFPEHGYVRLSVRDTGCGMDATVRDHLFEPYFTTRRVGEGSGMGLAVVHGIVRTHHGFIEVESEPGRGSAFHLYFPCTQAVHSDSGDLAAAPVPRGRETILLVDNEPGVVATMQRILTGLGYQVTATCSSTEALDIFRARMNDFHLVITDQAMPKKSGLELASEFRTLRPDLPVILCTGFSTTIHEGNFRHFGIQALLRKPSTREELGCLVRQVLASPAAVSRPPL